MPDVSRRSHLAALAGLLCCLCLAMLLYHDLAGGTLFAANVYDSYSLQAQNWLEGRLYIQNGEDLSWLELAIFNGRYYQSFPPVPAVVMLPWVALLGGWQNVPSNFIQAIAWLLCAAAAYACFWRRDATPRTCVFFAAFLALGSGLFWLGTSGGVWFTAQVFGLCFALWGMFFALAQTPGQDAAASLLFALAVGCRPFFAVLAVLWACKRLWAAKSAPRPLEAALAVALPAAAVAAALLGYNFARFGNPLEFGHNYLPEFTRAENGQFSLSYLLPNLKNLLRPVTLGADGQLSWPEFNGFLPFVANPLFALWAAVPLAARLGRRPAPARTALALPSSGPVTAAAFFAALVFTCLHKTLGGWQFGARYTVDLLVWPLCWFLAHRTPYRPGTAALALCGAAILFNLYGAVAMLSL